jgi:hypothetical protein
MTDQALSSALNTIAPVAAALAALIGFLGIWRLDRLREVKDRFEDEVRALVMQIDGGDKPAEAPSYYGREYFLERAEELVKHPETAGGQSKVQAVHSRLQPQWERYKRLPGEQQRLMRVLTHFLVLTFAILVVAIGLLAFTDELSARAWMTWILKGFVILANIGLAIGPFYLVREAARSIHVSLALVLLLGLTSPTLAGSVRCTTYAEKPLGRLHTLCDDGTRAISTDNKTLSRWETTITESPRSVRRYQRSVTFTNP